MVLCPKPQHIHELQPATSLHLNLERLDINLIGENLGDALQEQLEFIFRYFVTANPTVHTNHGDPNTETNTNTNRPNTITFQIANSHLQLEHICQKCCPQIPHTIAQREAYTIEVTDKEMICRALFPRGLFRAACTVAQLLLVNRMDDNNAKISACVIVDFPDLLHRAFMLDVSRGKVPTHETLRQYVDLLAFFKYNELQLYVEHTFQYPGYEDVWRDTGALQADDITWLAEYCTSRHIQLIPNQNTLGHMHHWLKHERLSHLAECPAGVLHPFSQTREPFSLCPTNPAVLTFVGELLDELLPHFKQPEPPAVAYVNVNLDEAFDIGRGLSKRHAKGGGAINVYLEYLTQLNGMVRTRGYHTMCWADMLMKHPSQLGRVGRDVTLLEWGYEQNHDFNTHCGTLAGQGVRFYVCPGTSSWSSVAGRLHNMVGNVVGAVRAAHRFGGAGVMLVEWGDGGHIQPMFVCYPAIVLCGEMMWNKEAVPPENFVIPEFVQEFIVPRLNSFVFRDASNILGNVVCELGNVYSALGVKPPNSSLLFWGFNIPQSLTNNHTVRAGTSMLVGMDLTPATRVAGIIFGRQLARLVGVYPHHFHTALASLEQLLPRIADARPQCADGQIILREMRWVLRVCQWACRLWLARVRVGLHKGVNAIAKHPKEARPLADEAHDISRELEDLWVMRASRFGARDAARQFRDIESALKVTNNSL